LLKNLLPRYGIKTTFVNMQDHDAVRAAITPQTKVIYTESISNPLLEVSDIPGLSAMAKEKGLKLVVDNTFSPMIVSPLRLGADVVVHSMTKFINGTSDCVAGCVVSSHEFIHGLIDVNSGTGMLLGPVLDGIRAASLLKNLHSLHIRMTKHGENAMYVAKNLREEGLTVFYPGLANHPQHELLTRLMNPGFGYGGILAIDANDGVSANKLMALMQQKKVGYLAVSLGYFKTLFSAPGHSTSSEIPLAERTEMGISEGMIRFSIGLDSDIQRTFGIIRDCVREVGLIK
jgi:methionine-gamma-lyase